MKMRPLPLIAGVVATLVGLAILLFAEGLRRYYSGLFFVIIGLFLLRTARQA